jgi:hypothetical protein
VDIYFEAKIVSWCPLEEGGDGSIKGGKKRSREIDEQEEEVVHVNRSKRDSGKRSRRSKTLKESEDESKEVVNAKKKSTRSLDDSEEEVERHRSRSRSEKRKRREKETVELPSEEEVENPRSRSRSEKKASRQRWQDETEAESSDEEVVEKLGRSKSKSRKKEKARGREEMESVPISIEPNVELELKLKTRKKREEVQSVPRKELELSPSPSSKTKSHERVETVFDDDMEEEIPIRVSGRDTNKVVNKPSAERVEASKKTVGKDEVVEANVETDTSAKTSREDVAAMVEPAKETESMVEANEPKSINKAQDEKEAVVKTTKQTKKEARELLRLQKKQKDEASQHKQTEEAPNQLSRLEESVPKKKLRGSHVVSVPEPAKDSSKKRFNNRLSESTAAVEKVSQLSSRDQVTSSAKPAAVKPTDAAQIGDKKKVLGAFTREQGALPTDNYAKFTAPIPKKPKPPPPPTSEKSAIGSAAETNLSKSKSEKLTAAALSREPSPAKPKPPPPPLPAAKAKPERRGKRDRRTSKSPPRADHIDDPIGSRKKSLIDDFSSAGNNDAKRKNQSDKSTQSAESKTPEPKSGIARLCKALKKIADKKYSLETDEYLNSIKSDDDSSNTSEVEEWSDEPPEKVGQGVPLYNKEKEFASDDDDDESESDISEREIQQTANGLDFETMWKMKLDQTAEMLKGGRSFSSS